MYKNLNKLINHQLRPINNNPPIKQKAVKEVWHNQTNQVDQNKTNKRRRRRNNKNKR